MNEPEARTVLWIKAVEENDPSGAVLTRARRSQAGREARAKAEEEPAAMPAGPNERFLVRRAEILQSALQEEFPAIDEQPRGGRWGKGGLALLLLLSFAAGLSANYFGPERRISILAFPLLGVLAWNLAVYLALVVRTAAGLARGDSNREAAGALTVRLLKLTRWNREAPAVRNPETRDIFSSSLRQFRREWLMAALPLYAMRFRLALHLGAAFVALGILGGMYLRGLGYEYRAGWESTFLDAGAVHRVLTVVLGPASALAGIPIPDVEQIEQMRWREGQPGAEAAPWIHLYAVTALLVVFMPRLGLALIAFLRLKRCEREFRPGLTESSAYFRRLSRQQPPGLGATVLVAPYNYSPDKRAEETLRELIRDCLGPDARIEIRPAAAYGDEDALLDTLRGTNEPADYLVALFNLAATPEDETHGQLMRGLRDLARQGETCRHLLVLIDVSPFRARFGTQDFFGKRLGERIQAWNRLAKSHGLSALTIDLEQMPADFSCEQLEQCAWSATSS